MNPHLNKVICLLNLQTFKVKGGPRSSRDKGGGAVFKKGFFGPSGLNMV